MSILILMMVFALTAIAPVQAENKWYSANQTIGTVGAIGTDVYRTKTYGDIERRRIEAQRQSDADWAQTQRRRDVEWANVEHHRLEVESERNQLETAARIGEISAQTGRGITARANGSSVSAGTSSSIGRPMTDEERAHCQKYPNRGFCSGN